MSNLTYLYAITPAPHDLLRELGPVKGVEDGELEGLAEGDLLAVISQVSGEDWSSGALDERVRDMEWLAPRATRHQEVLAALHAVAPSLLPLPFATLYHRPQAIRDLLRARQSELVAALDRLHGAEEWTLKVYQEQPVFERHVDQLSPLIVEAVERLRSASPGKAYLLRKQLDTLRRDEAARLATRLAGEIEARIAALTPEVIREPVAGKAGTEAAGAEARLALKLALLIRRDRRDDFHGRLAATVDEYAPLGYRFELTGPWPAYSFATIRPEESG